MTNRVLWGAGLILCLLTGLHNIGCISMDDYTNAVAVMIPAQKADTLLHDALLQGPHPPIPKVVANSLARIPLWLGVKEAIWQLRLSLVLLGLWSFTLCAWVAVQLFDTDRKKKLAVGFLAFFAFMPLFFTRPMNESLSMPFIMLSLLFVTRYDRKGGLTDLVLGIVFLGVASLLRYQTGVCGLGILFAVSIKKRARDWGVLALAVVAIFLLTGLTDLFIGKSFHGSLLEYISYNLTAGEKHGKVAFYAFLLLWLGLTLPPAFFSRYKNFSWRESFRSLRIGVIYFTVFTLFHSISPHKEDRFMVPMLPVFLMLLVPLADFLMSEPRSKWRVAYALSVNLILLIGVSYNIPQRNGILLSEFMSQTPKYRGVISVENSVIPAQLAYSTRDYPVEIVPLSRIKQAPNPSCQDLYVVRYDFLLGDADYFSKSFTQVAEFSPGLFEGILVQLNERPNARRGKLVGFVPRSCRVASRHQPTSR